MKKKKFIINIKKLNVIIEKNVYFMFIQLNMMLKMTDVDIITIIDITVFFH